ncbi:SDR family oxidoreductase [Paracoccus zhejiangensis]|uniref:2,3-dihydro-2,3-dihydroxybenzoate dehydrogenase n=1 Tax=Paracoccus zhejiangensis TaxID=1077935 RepID=A0A2H5EZA9_9RHOB|nr:SDR family oxidoreductase [Paracoccus zhejiangensis]AUH64624.1 2,3-dihydro-2,3-dihydroxybenzoate dehydrogenase [Paracoccus zhejiangensis]
MRLTGFEDRAAFVTGAAGGIGVALVRLLRASGAKVFATDRADALAVQSLPTDCGIMWHPLDVRDGAAVDAALAAAVRVFGPVTHGVHAAGVLSTQPLLASTDEDWQRVIDINAGGTFRVTRALGRHMAAEGKGAIVVIGSNAGGVPRQNMGSYAASKAAAAMLVRCLGLELAPLGVRCNIVAPGSTLTPMQTGMWADDQGAARVIAGDLASFKTGIPLGKIATPEDIAQAALFLLSDQAGHVTMADLYVDGGATLRA